MVLQGGHWHRVENSAEIESPALLVYPERIAQNIRRMIIVAGSPDRLRPHLKTVKMPEVVKMLMAQGIEQFKCATIAEAEMAAEAGARDVLLANQPVGPNIGRLRLLVARYPVTRFSTIVDDESVARALSAAFNSERSRLEVWLDIDCGMHRTGMQPGPAAIGFYSWLNSLPGLKAGGLHAYGGHVQEPDPSLRADHCHKAFEAVTELRRQLERETGGPVRLIADGAPTFAIQAERGDMECSPGTCLLWDFGYADRYPDLGFQQAALVLTRVSSKPCADRLCLDLGHKAIAAENPHPRVRFMELPDAEAVVHSEEHLVIRSPRAEEFAVGDVLFGVPRHICPTVALYAEAVVVRDGRAVGRWKVTARDRRITI